MKKPIPSFQTDEDAERFVDTADLRTFDLSGGEIVRFELQPKDKSVSLRLPESLLVEVRARAARAGMPYQRFMRLAIERALQDPAKESADRSRPAGRLRRRGRCAGVGARPRGERERPRHRHRRRAPLR